MFFEIRFFILFLVVVEVILPFFKLFSFSFSFSQFSFSRRRCGFFIDVCGLMGILGGSDVSVALALFVAFDALAFFVGLVALDVLDVFVL